MKKNASMKRSAFLLNMNAKSVTAKLKEKLIGIIPPGDLFFTKSINEASNSLIEIIERQYAFVFCGGGDGTVVSTINMLEKLKKTYHSRSSIPRIGVLRLGTGNAMARMLGAGDPIKDISDIMTGKKIDIKAVSMIETEDGILAPFAGIGYDGEIIGDFASMKNLFFQSPFRKIFTSFLGFTLVGLFKTIPRQMTKKPVRSLVKSSFPAYRIERILEKDEEIFVPKEQILFDDFAPLISVGTVESVGYDFKLFPFAKRRPGYMHLRICAVPLSICVANFYPSLWHGEFRHKKLYDYLVKDVSIESSEGVHYQLAGDAMGKKKRLFFKVHAEPIEMALLNRSQKNIQLPSNPLLTPLKGGTRA